MLFQDQETSFKNFFVPLTTIKAIHWIIFIGIIAYVNSLFNGFVWDDISYIIQNPGVQSFNIPLQFQQNLFNNAGQYRALTTTYFTILYAMSGTNPFIYHLIQMLLHICNAIFVYFLFKKFFKPTISLVLALIFLVHPMQVESVSYISAAGSELFFIFGMLMLKTVWKETLNNRDWVVIFAMFLCSLLSKEAGILFAFVGCTYILLFNKKYVMQSIIVMLSSIIVYFGMRIGIGGVYFETRPLIPIDRLSFPQRLLTLPQILIFYIKTFFFPINLTIDQQWVVTSATKGFYISFITLIAFLGGIFVYFTKFIKGNSKQSKIFLFFLVWTIVGFGLYSQIFPLDMTVADRWIYFPIVGMLGLIGTVVTFVPFLQKNSKVVLSLFILIITILSILTVIRNAFWYDSVTLYSHDTKIQTNFLIENDFAQHLLLKGDIKNALIHQQKSVTLFPYEQNILNLGNLYEKSGNISEAKRYYILALQSKSYIPWQYNHIVFSYMKLGKILLIENKPKESLTVLNEGIKDYGESSNSGTLWYLLALIQYKLHHLEEAKAAAQKASILLSTQDSTNLYMKLQANENIDVQSYLRILP
jgi:hypothetical protein